MKEQITSLFEAVLDQLMARGQLTEDARRPVHVEATRDPTHGDFATNVALLHAKALGLAPRQLAEQLVSQLPTHPQIAGVEIAGPGFINIRLKADALVQPIKDCLTQGSGYGRGESTGRRVQVEYVSANPTGPLHVGHGRGAAYGATLSNLLSAVGHTVETEYYVNDAGRQMSILGASVYIRYLEALGHPLQFPLGGYQGAYIQDLAAELIHTHGESLERPIASLTSQLVADGEETKDAHIDSWIQAIKHALGEDWRVPFDLALTRIQDDIRDDLGDFGVTFSQWFSEASLVSSGAIADALATLEAGGHLYQHEGALWFRSTAYGDDKDRVVQRDNGEYTYFASDIAYIANKFSRGYDELIYVWGADHHGYITRVKAAASALGYDPDRLIIRLVQFAILYRGGERVQMSTRSGSFVTLRELREEVGVDACRYFYVMRKADQHLDFDLDLATSQSKDNPVYYIQYAHARICRVFEGLQDQPSFDLTRGLTHLASIEGQEVLDIAQQIGQFKETLGRAADSLEPHLLCYYLQELAASFHRWYNGTRLLVDDLAQRDARLTVAQAVRQVLANGLSLLGVSAPEAM